MQNYVDIMKHFDKLLRDNETIKKGKVKEQYFTRKSKLGFEELIKFILSRTGKTTSNEINNYYSEIDKLEKSISKQSIFQAREKLNPIVFRYLNQEMIKQYYKKKIFQKEKDYVLLAIDGTVLEMPLNKQTEKAFGLNRSNEKAIYTKTMPRCSGVYDVLNNIYLDLVVNHYTISEIPMAYSQIKIIQEILDKEKCIFLADRYYGATDLFLYIESLGYKYCFRGKKNFYKYYIDDKSKDSIISIPLDEKWINRFKIEEVKVVASKEKKINIRVIKFNKSQVIGRELEKDEEIILFTNLSEEEFSREEIIRMYGKRWKIKTGYGILKTKMELERVTSEKPNLILQDIYSQIIVYNQMSIIKNIADKTINTKGKYKYQININNLVNLYRKWLPKILSNVKLVYSILKNLLNKIIKNKEPIRENRFFKRWNTYINKPPTLKFRVDGKRNPTTHKTTKGYLRISR